MSKIIAIMGLSGVGKTTIAKKLHAKMRLPFKISYTTRPIRPGERNGIDYHFIDEGEYAFLDSHNFLVAKQDFKVANGETWRYAIYKGDLKKDCIMVLTPSGVNDLRNLGYDVKAIYLDVDEEERLNRICNRNDNQSHEEIKRRSKADKEVFKDFKPDLVVKNNSRIDLTIKEIIKFVEGN